MAEANDKYGIIYQNLVDAGCTALFCPVIIKMCSM